MKNILVAIDFTEVSALTLAKAVELAEKFSCRIWLIHIAAPAPDFVGYDDGPRYLRDSRARILRQEHKVLQDYAADIREKGIETEALLIQGPTVETLLEKAEDLAVDLIVMGAHNHGVLFEKLIGSTWSELVRKSRIPLLIVPESGKGEDENR
jgi:nucleotide-binding universal stress UspA family protein